MQVLFANLVGVDIIYSASSLENPTVTSEKFLLELSIVTYFKRAWQALKKCANCTSINPHFLRSRIYVLSTYHTFLHN
jgi:hypothetical protein